MTCAGHNRLSCAECGVVPVPLHERGAQLIASLSAVMGEQKLQRVRYVAGEFELEIERHASAFVVPAPVGETEHDRSDNCACGHSLSVEHTETGCYRGCSPELCNTTEVQP